MEGCLYIDKGKISTLEKSREKSIKIMKKWTFYIKKKKIVKRNTMGMIQNISIKHNFFIFIFKRTLNRIDSVYYAEECRFWTTLRKDIKKSLIRH